MPKYKNAKELILSSLELFINPNATEILGWILFVVGTVTFTSWCSAVSDLHPLEASGTKVVTTSSIIGYHQMPSGERPWLEMPALKQEAPEFLFVPQFSLQISNYSLGVEDIRLTFKCQEPQSHPHSRSTQKLCSHLAILTCLKGKTKGTMLSFVRNFNFKRTKLFRVYDLQASNQL